MHIRISIFLISGSDSFVKLKSRTKYCHYRKELLAVNRLSRPVFPYFCALLNVACTYFSGPSEAVLTSLPVYFRLKPTLRTASGRKCRKPRTVFTELQLIVLNREFNEHKYLSTPQRTKLAERLGLNQTQVKTWFQNRRMKWKKETTEVERKGDQFNADIHSESENETSVHEEEDSC